MEMKKNKKYEQKGTINKKLVDISIKLIIRAKMKEEQNDSAVILENALKEYNKAKQNNEVIPENFIKYIKEKNQNTKSSTK